MDARTSKSLNARLANPAARDHVAAGNQLDTSPLGQDEADTSPDQPEPSLRRPLVTSWANAFPSRARTAVTVETDLSEPSQSESPSLRVATPQNTSPIDTRGKTRAQIKAEEYERACGEHWREYQDCLKVRSEVYWTGLELMSKGAVARNTSLTTLLEQAREEHPLASQEGLGGTAWDKDTK